MKPDFIVIGAARSGTTWIAKNLGSHPEVYVPFKKELHFFDNHYEEGWSFYENFFKDCGGARAIGEATPAYLHKTIAAGRIKEHLPNAKLVVSLRNPIDRLYSRYWKSRGRFEENKELSFEDKIEQKPEFITEGFYIDHLRRYLELFPREQLLALLFDDLSDDPAGFMRSIYEFIGVASDYQSELVSHQINAGAAQKLVVRSRSAFWAGKVLRYAGMHSAARRLEEKNAASLPQMNVATRSRLVEVYREKNTELAELIDRSLDHWNQ